jgi:hypothetical protein
VRRLKSIYTGLAVLLLSTFLILTFLNLSFAGLSALRHALRPDPGPIWQYGWQPIFTAYPGWKQKEIVELLNGVYFDHSIEYESFTQFRERPRQTKYVSVDGAGFRNVKDQGPWPPDPACENIFVFGGSTTFGYGVTNEETIPSWLQERASVGESRKPVRVYNFGRGYYFSSQETVLFCRLLVSKVVPDVAVFIDGLNDFVYPDGEPEYTSRLASSMDGSQIPDFLTKSPLNRAALFVRQRFLQLPLPAEDKQSGPKLYEKQARAVIERWRLNKKLTQAVATSFGVRTVFVWQPAPTYKYDLRYHAFSKGNFRLFGPHERSRAGYAVMDQLRQNGGMGDDFLWLGDIQEQRTENLYVDLLHYRPSFAKVIANDIYDFILQQGLLAGKEAGSKEVQ